MDTSNPIIFGKDNTQRIISIEDQFDGTINLYIQNEDGSVSTKTETKEYWILTDKPVDDQSIPLHGNGHFKYVNLFQTAEEFAYAKSRFYRMRNVKDISFWCNDNKESFMLYSGYTYYKGLKQNEVSTLAFDIETTGLEHNENSKLLLISNTFKDHNGIITRKLFSYDEYETAADFINAWCDWVQRVNPAIMLGHNIFGFDLPYLDYIATNSGTVLTLGRENQPIEFANYTSKKRKDGSQFIEYKKAHIAGRELVDTFFLALSYDIGRKYISYGLKQIIEHEGLEVQGRVFYDASKIRTNYTILEEWEKIKAYAEFDADDALALWNLMGAATFYWTQSVPKCLQEIVCGATGSQINAMLIRGYLQEGHSLPKASEIPQFAGGLVLGIPGIYSNTLKWDILSAYPSTMMVYKIYDKVKDPKAYMLQMVEYFFNARREYKKLGKETGDQYYKDLDATFKVGINSMYGTLGANGLLFNSGACAAEVTSRCRGYIETAIEWATGRTFDYWQRKNEHE